MGLDQYLRKHNYVRNWSYMKDEEKHEVIVTKGGQPVTSIKPERIAYIVEDIMDWRKANQIHAWFVKNVQDGNDDCKEYYVSGDQLEELVNTCKKALEIINNADVKYTQVETGWNNDGKTFENIPTFDCEDAINEVLPPQSGFFFGGTEIDEWYKRDIERTIEVLEPLIDDGGDFYYSSSW